LYAWIYLYVALQITIRGNDNSWGYDSSNAAALGKQQHMASAVAEFGDTFRATITKNSTLLIDDDELNVNIALHNNVRAVVCDPTLNRYVHPSIHPCYLSMNQCTDLTSV
jgi:hypothetical protein